VTRGSAAPVATAGVGETSEPGARTIVTMRDVVKRYGPFEALQGISMTVDEGEIVVVIGPSGSGKSTLIRTINALEPFDAGTVAVDGIALDGSRRSVDKVRRKVGMVFQQFNLFPHLTVLRNITLAPQVVLGLSEKETRSTAIGLLRRVGLEGHANKYPNQLSGGEQQRVAIARALALRPRVLLCDEITSALDPEMVNEVLEVIQELALSGMTMVIVTHEMAFAARVAKRVLFMDKGKVVEEGAPRQIFESPREERTRAFLSKILSH
jgi:general L-amino acid transport system ATP-binding protein